MDGIREYLLGVCGAAIVCALVSGLVEKKGMLGATAKLLTGMFMVVTLLGPLVNLRITGLEAILVDVSEEADTLAASGENSAREAMEVIIKERTEAYILDKAKSMGAVLTVEVSLTSDDVPVPRAVRISGSISPYGKKILTELIQDDLGIPREAQTWN